MDDHGDDDDDDDDEEDPVNFDDGRGLCLPVVDGRTLIAPVYPHTNTHTHAANCTPKTPKNRISLPGQKL